MTLAIDIPSPSARAERNGVIRFVVRLFREKPLGAAGGVIFILFMLCGIFADVLAPYGMNQISPRNRLLAPSWAYPVRHRQSRPRHALALPVRRADLGDYSLYRRHTGHDHLDRQSVSSPAISAARSISLPSASSMPG